MFQLDENNQSTMVAGCPPDNFSADGQLWGNPLYDWDYHKKTGFHWWVTRMWYSFKLYDMVRIDHFRGFDEYFAIPAGKSAKAGHWEKGPGMDLFNMLEEKLGERAVIAEDLGLMTPGVRKLVKDSGYPNMKVIQFGFDARDFGGGNEYLPHNYLNNCVVYTGTHDNETLAGWFNGLDKENQDHIRKYLRDDFTPAKQMYKKLIDMAMMSCADTCIIPIQDWLGLPNTARMNTPGTVDVNWSWRLDAKLLTEEVQKEVLTVTMRYGRANWDALNPKKPEKAEEKDQVPEETEEA